MRESASADGWLWPLRFCPSGPKNCLSAHFLSSKSLESEATEGESIPQILGELHGGFAGLGMVGLCSLVRFSVHRLFSLPELHVHLAHVGHGGIQGICQGGVHILLALHGAEHHGVVCLGFLGNAKGSKCATIEI